MAAPPPVLDLARAVRLIVIGLALLLCSCQTTNGTRIGWSSSVRSTEYSAAYATFNGTASIPINIRESRVFFTYQVEVGKGSLSIAVQDPQGQGVWRTTLQGNATGSRLLSTPRTGSYTLLVEGQNTGGSFDIHWN
jgi:hypothetical protein